MRASQPSERNARRYLLENNMNLPRFYKRRQTRTVFIGQMGVGGNHPIRVQSMTTSDTKNTAAVIQEMKDLMQVGCEIIRVTVPTKEDAKNLANIRAAMKQEGIKTPLVADIHFSPSIAMDVVPFVDKVRINPGNFVDKKLFKNQEYTDPDYQHELKRIEEKFTPLVLKCKEHGISLRIGTNHGSLSDRIMSRYGDTPEGMVESALEFLKIAAKLDYHDIILSMKASNTVVMVAAYRLLAKRLDKEGMNYPFHLGVTEAGDAEDGRIKSAVGIGTLLEEGIGDTIRVSLTEDSVHEIPVAYALAAPYNQIVAFQNYSLTSNTPDHLNFLFQNRYTPTYSRRQAQRCQVGTISFGEKEPVRVWTFLNHTDSWNDLVKAEDKDIAFEGIEMTLETGSSELIKKMKLLTRPLSVISNDASALQGAHGADKIVFLIQKRDDISHVTSLMRTSQKNQTHLEFCFDVSSYPFFDTTLTKEIAIIQKANQENNFNNVSYSLRTIHPAQDYRILAQALKTLKEKIPLHLRYHASSAPTLTDASTQLGALLMDGIGDSIQIDSTLGKKNELQLAYALLQACRVRITKTDFIACPSCGRTQFDLQDVTAKIKGKTSHLKGVKIAIMGCIVNGPGEMADADFGYVGTGPKKVSLYVGKECVKRNIPEEMALNELITLIQIHGMWTD